MALRFEILPTDLDRTVDFFTSLLRGAGRQVIRADWNRGLALLDSVSFPDLS